jgi:crotonobetainyl-CoA:carnitine CoA-transferase CaiB-like acyl-CoA transferase
MPLSNLRVLSFGHYVAGPLAASLLAEQGADVVQILNPKGNGSSDPFRTLLQRDTTRVRLDLKLWRARALAMTLVLKADVIIENFRPGVMARLGLDKDTCRRVNPRLVYLSLPGFASHDTTPVAGEGSAALHSIQAWEAVILARSGVLLNAGLNRQLMGCQVNYTSLPLASVYGAVLGVAGVTMALCAREKSNIGCDLEVPLASALLDSLVHNSLHVTELPERYKCAREMELERRRACTQPPLSKVAVKNFQDPFYSTYDCSDRPIYLVAPAHLRHQLRALQVVLGIDPASAAALYGMASPWKGSSMGLGGKQLGEEASDQLRCRLREAFRKRPAHEWERILAEARVPCAAVNTCTEWRDLHHTTASGLLSVAPPELQARGVLRVPGPVAWIRSEGGTFNTQKSMTQKTSASGDMGALLQGVRIVDLCNVIAGPTVGELLSRFGAEVIKIDAAYPTYDPIIAVRYGMVANRGKRSVLLDVRSTAGKDARHAILKDADLVVVNAPAQDMPAYGLSLDDLRKANPNIVLCQFDAYGGVHETGPRINDVSYDDNLQGALGIMAYFGGGLYTPEEHLHVGTIDVVSGFAGAFAAALGLLTSRRSKHAGVTVARTSLAATGQLLVLPWLTTAKELCGGGSDARGEHALYRAYQAADSSWIFLAAAPPDAAQAELIGALCHLPIALTGTDRSDFTPHGEVARQLEDLFRMMPAQELQLLLASAGIVTPLRSLESLREEHKNAPTTSSYIFSHDEEHPCNRQVTSFAPCGIRVDGNIPVQTAAPMYGQDTITVLAQHSLDAATLIRQGIASTSWADEYLPTDNCTAEKASIDRVPEKRSLDWDLQCDLHHLIDAIK